MRFILIYTILHAYLKKKYSKLFTIVTEQTKAFRFHILKLEY